MSFAIIASARTGSTHLSSLLHSHPDIFCNGEICHKKTVYVRWKKVDRSQEVLAELAALRDRDPRAFLSRILAMDYGRREVGFKFLKGQNKQMYKAIMADKQINKIVLFRRNVLANYSSMLIAAESGRYQRRSGNKKERLSDAPPVRFQEAEFLSFCSKYNKYYRGVMAKLRQSGQYYYLMNYEDINEPEIFANLLRFLGSEATGRKSPERIVKQNPSHILSRFANAGEVQDFLTRYNLMHWAYEGELSLSAFDDKPDRVPAADMTSDETGPHEPGVARASASDDAGHRAGPGPFSMADAGELSVD